MPRLPITPGMVRSHLVPRPRVRRAVRGVALGGGGLTLIGMTGVGVLVAEARLARRWIERRMSAPHPVDGRYDATGRTGLTPSDDGHGTPDGPGALDGPVLLDGPDALDGPRPLVAAVLGDSAAAGLGADDPAATPGALLATGLAASTGRPVDLVSAVRVGAVSAELGGFVDRLEADGVRPDVVLVIVGGNDVTKRVPAGVAAAQLGAAVARLVDRGALVVVGTVPDLSTLTPVQQPLRALGGRWSRLLAVAQTAATLAAGGHPVDLRGLTAADFHAEGALLFSEDRFHPSTDGYRRTMAHVVPVVLDLLGSTTGAGCARR